MTIQNVDYNAMMSNQTLYDQFELTVRTVVADEAGPLVLKEHVNIKVTPGSVHVESTIAMIGAVDPQVVQSHFVANSTLETSLIWQIQTIPGFVAALVTGTLTVSVSSVTIENSTAVGFTAADATSTTGANAAAPSESTGLLVGIIIGAALFILCACGLMRWARCYNLGKRERDNQQANEVEVDLEADLGRGDSDADLSLHSV